MTQPATVSKSAIANPAAISLRVRAANRIGDLLLRIQPSLGKFDERSLLSIAQHRTALADFGDCDYLTPLRALIASYATDDNLTFLGKVVARGMLIHILANRLRIYDVLQRDEFIAAEPIVRPLFVVGLPRTGTTLLYNLLAHDSRARPLMFWETMSPVSVPARGRGTDSRKTRAERTVGRLNRLIPQLRTIHELDPHGPDECTGLLFNTLVTPFFRGRICEYRSWLFSAPAARLEQSYREYRQQLQILQRQHRGDYWLLKSASHLFGLSALRNEFPDAGIIFTHRDPARALASLCSLTAALDTLSYRRIDLHEVGRRCTEIVEQCLKRSLEARSQLPSDLVIDLRYDSWIQDPVATVEAIYQQLGFECRPELVQRWTRYLVTHPQHKYGRHMYSLEQFGQHRQQLPAVFEEYRRDVGVDIE